MAMITQPTLPYLFAIAVKVAGVFLQGIAERNYVEGQGDHPCLIHGHPAPALRRLERRLGLGLALSFALALEVFLLVLAGGVLQS